MSRVILVGNPDGWERFAQSALQAAGCSILSIPQERWFDPSFNPAIGSDDLMVLSAPEGELPSAALGRVFRRLGHPVRVLVVDGRADYTRAGDALRGCAVGYEARPWNKERLLELVRSSERQAPPDQNAIDRRFGPWRAAG